MRVISLLLFLLVVLIGVSFATLNAESVKVNYYFGVITMPVSLLIVSSLVLGLLLGVVLTGFRIIRSSTENLRLKQRLKLVEKEVENLRAIPIKNEQ